MDPIQWKLNLIFLALLWLGAWLWIQARRIRTVTLWMGDLKKMAETRAKRTTGNQPGFERI